MSTPKTRIYSGKLLSAFWFNFPVAFFPGLWFGVGVLEKRNGIMEQDIQKSFNDSIGAILTYLDEAQVGFAIKKAVKSELWELCDRKIMPLVGKGSGHGQDNAGNR